MKRNKQTASRGEASPPCTALKKNKRGRKPPVRVGQAAAATAGLRIQFEKEHDDDELQDDALDDEQKDDALDDASQQAASENLADAAKEAGMVADAAEAEAVPEIMGGDDDSGGELSQDIQLQPSTHPGTTYPISAIESLTPIMKSGGNIFGSLDDKYCDA